MLLKPFEFSALAGWLAMMLVTCCLAPACSPDVIFIGCDADRDCGPPLGPGCDWQCGGLGTCQSTCVDFPVSEKAGLFPTAIWNSNDDEFLVLWQGFREPDPETGWIPWEAHAAVIGRDGVHPFFVQDPYQHYMYCPAAAFNRAADEYLIVWENELGIQGVMARRFTSRGEPLGEAFWVHPEGFANSASCPAVVYNPEAMESLVVWQEHIGTEPDESRVVMARRFDWKNHPIAEAQLLCPAGDAMFHDDFHASYNPDRREYLVSWEEAGELAGFFTTVFVRLDDQARLLKGPALLNRPPREQSIPANAYSPVTQRYLVTYLDTQSGVFRGQLLYPDGQPIGDPASLLSSPSESGTPYAAPTQTLYDPTLGSFHSALATQGDTGEFRVVGLRIDERGLTPPSETLLVDWTGINSYGGFQAGLARSGIDGRYLVVWSAPETIRARVFHWE
jgi:hypothetical protein